MKSGDKFETSFNPAGFIEQIFMGNQTPDSVIAAVEELIKRAKKLKAEGEKALILVDVTGVPKIDISGKMARARQQAVKAMATAQYDRIAVYGNVAVQIMVNTLVLIAGKRDKIRVFGNRVDALRWLKNGS
jgi:hypothetical protein